MDYTNLFSKAKLPNTLSKSETETYFKNFKVGDLDAREQLFIHNIRLVMYQVKSFNRLWLMMKN